MVIYFARNLFCSIQKHIICKIYFSKFSDVLPAFTCAKVVGKLRSIFIGVSIFHFVAFIGNISHLKLLRVNSPLS